MELSTVEKIVDNPKNDRQFLDRGGDQQIAHRAAMPRQWWRKCDPLSRFSRSDHLNRINSWVMNHILFPSSTSVVELTKTVFVLVIRSLELEIGTPQTPGPQNLELGIQKF